VPIKHEPNGEEVEHYAETGIPAQKAGEVERQSKNSWEGEQSQDEFELTDRGGKNKKKKIVHQKSETNKKP